MESMRIEPSVGGVLTAFMFGLVISSIVFIPVLVAVLVFAKKVVDHRAAFLVSGPVVFTALAYWLFDTGSAKLIATSTGVSSLVLFLLLRSKSFAADAAAHPPSTT